MTTTTTKSHTGRRFLLPAFLSLLLLTVGCSDKDNGLLGDNRILSFALTVGDTKYVAYSEGEDKLVLEVPVGVDLTEARAEYRLSEQATIFPAPERIRDWDDDQVFRVTSFSGEGRSYILRIERQYPTSPYDVYLTTDEEVRTFGATHTGVIRGNLFIGTASGTDSISDLSPLTSLTKVEQGVFVRSTFRGRNLDGLRNITDLGSLSIVDAPHLESLELRSLRRIRKDMILSSNVLSEVKMPLLATVGGTISLSGEGLRSFLLEGLTHVGALQVSACKNLSTLNLPQLEEVRGDLKFTNNDMLSELKLRRLEQIAGDLMLVSDPLLQNISFPALTRCGKLSVSLDKMTDLALPLLETAGSVSLQSVSQLVRLSMPKLTEVKGDFTLTNAGVKSIATIPLRVVEGKLTIANVSNLSNLGLSLSALTRVKEISIDTYQGHEEVDLSGSGVESLTLKDVPYFKSIALPETMEQVRLTGFSHVSSVEDGGVETLPEIQGLKEVGTLKISNYWTKEPLEEYIIPSLERVTKHAELQLAMVDRVKLPALKSIASLSVNYITKFYKKEELRLAADLRAVDCPLLTEAGDITINSVTLAELQMPALRTARSITLRCSDRSLWNEAMTDLSGLSALEKLEKLSVNNLHAFRDYSFARKAVESGSLTSFSASGCAYNPSLEDLKEGRYTAK